MFKKNYFSKIFITMFLINYIAAIFIMLYLFILNKRTINYDGMYIDLILLLVAFSFCIIFLSHKISFYSEEDRKTKETFLKNELYMVYGKNITGAIHNIKNKLSPIYLLLDEIKDDKNIDVELKNFAKEQLQNSNGIINLLDELLYLVKIKNIEHIESVNVNYLVLSIYELFKINLDFKNNVNFKIIKLGKDLIINTKAFELMQIIEIIIRNAWNNIKDFKTEKIIIIEINSINGYISIMNNSSNLFKMERDEMFKSKKIFIEGYITNNNFNIENINMDNFAGYKINLINKKS